MCERKKILVPKENKKSKKNKWKKKSVQYFYIEFRSV